MSLLILREHVHITVVEGKPSSRNILAKGKEVIKLQDDEKQNESRRKQSCEGERSLTFLVMRTAALTRLCSLQRRF